MQDINFLPLSNCGSLQGSTGIIEEQLAHFIANSLIVNIFGFPGHKVSVATTQLWWCSAKADIDNA